MRQWIRSHLTYANVMATGAVFLVLGGGTALGAIVISSNSQVAPGTISGHKPPSGKHSNIIAGSVNATDLANNSVTRASWAPFSGSAGATAPRPRSAPRGCCRWGACTSPTPAPTPRPWISGR